MLSLTTCVSAITSRINSQTSAKNNSRFSIGSATVAASDACRASIPFQD